jgi:hypothetical protein
MVPDIGATAGTPIPQELTGLKMNNVPINWLGGPATVTSAAAWSTTKISEGKPGRPGGVTVRSAATKTFVLVDVVGEVA